ncbi:hypothetical protein BP5796_08547 [Coleophoma crateriformis]|uniref:TRUD domain-containing protein n=1 Tax=Coleophoma crateriformis TaxID=565419 RepID=A0A3D8R877_9HELO|nr:hypothetical protein BP5796_08547 [Coleophoma crateriformis]
MASLSPSNDLDERPSKRIKASPTQLPSSSSTDCNTANITSGLAKMDPENPKPNDKSGGFQPEREAEVGILCFVNSTNPGFSGILKQRYTDFLVNEITPEGTVVHLTDDRAPKFSQLPKPDEAASVEPAGNTDENVTPPVRAEIKTEEKKTIAPRFAAQDVRLEDPEFAATIKPKSPAQTSTEAEQHAPVVKDVTNAQASPNTTEPNLDEPKTRASLLSADDEALLASYFGDTIKEQLIKFHAEVVSKPDKKASLFGSLMSDPIPDKEIRTKVHQDVRRIFSSTLETELVSDDVIKISAAPRAGAKQQNNPRQFRQGQSKGKLGWQELGGQYLHFSLYKENKDTMEVVSFLAKMLKLKPRDFAFSGTKDRRAVTVQRVSVFRQYADRVAGINRELRGSRVGNFKYEKHALELGELQGNQFHITLRNCHFGDDAGMDLTSRVQVANTIVGDAVKYLQQRGFLNYFGLQRFGTFGIGTDIVGTRILKGDFEGAVRAILTVSEESLRAVSDPGSVPEGTLVSRDDLARAEAISLFNKTGASHAALQKLPRKFSAELAIIRHLGHQARKTDYLGALQTINRNLKLMYVHAYQSLVWNAVTSERWSRYGDKVIQGDLVLVDGQAIRNAAAAKENEIDENGEVVIRPAVDDTALSHDDLFQRARPLSADEAASGQYSIFDIVLPTPGYDINYPDNDIGDYYKEFMSSERGGRLDPANMRRPQKDFSLSGSYRKILGQVTQQMSFEVKVYHDENEQLVETDLEKLQNSRSKHQRDNQSDRNGRQHNGQGDHRNGNDRVGRLQANAQAPAEDTAALAAWNALPTKLAAEDKAAAEVAAITALNSSNPSDIKQPTFKDTYIQTAIDQNGFAQRTGKRTTVMHQGTADEPAEASGIKVSKPLQNDGCSDSNMEVDNSNSLDRVTSSEVPSSSTADSADGGVRLDTSPARLTVKRSADSMLNGTDTTCDTVEQTPRTVMVQGEPVDAEDMASAKIGVIVKFALGSSQYATMALRELMKVGGVKTYKPDFSGGR